MPVRVELSKQHLLIHLGTAHLWNRKTSCPKNELAPTTISSCLTQSLSSEHRFWSQAPRLPTNCPCALCCPNFITGSCALSFMAVCNGHAYSIPCSSSLPSVVQGSMRLFQRGYKIKIVLIIIIRCYFPFLLSFTCNYTEEFSRGYRHVIMSLL